MKVTIWKIFRRNSGSNSGSADQKVFSAGMRIKTGRDVSNAKCMPFWTTLIPVLVSFLLTWLPLSKYWHAERAPAVMTVSKESEI